jgi:acyl-homoserine-lactone acylase
MRPRMPLSAPGALPLTAVSAVIQTEQRKVVQPVVSQGERVVITRQLTLALGILTATATTYPISPANAQNIQATSDKREYSAQIRRTEFGVPHIKANNWGDLGFGIGYALAEESICDIAQIHVTARAERSLFFGPTTENRNSDFYRQRLIDAKATEDLLSRPETRPSQDYLNLVDGYVAGYNTYLRRTGVHNLPDATCRGAEWVREITAIDYLRNRTAGRRGNLDAIPSIVAAAPPAAATASVSPASAPAAATTSKAVVAKVDAAKLSVPAAHTVEDPERILEGSNGWALGSEVTASKGGILISNPHTTWNVTTAPAFSPGRYHLFHVTIPGKLNFIGVSRTGSAVHHFGHNDHVARTHTVSTAERTVVYRLQLDPLDPTRTTYLYDGQPRKMQAYPVKIRQRQANGLIVELQTTLYYTHFGPVIESASMPWTNTVAHTLLSGNTEPQNIRIEEHKLALAQAGSTRELVEVLKKYQVQDNNTIAVDYRGETAFADIGNIPRVTDELVASCGVANGVLDGSRSACELGSDPDAARPGIFGPSKAVLRLGERYVVNANNTPWLFNLDNPITGLPQAFGAPTSSPGLRPRMSLRMVLDRLGGTDGFAGNQFTFENSQEILLRMRVLGGELVRDALVSACQQQPLVNLPGIGNVDLNEGCSALAGWDLTYRVDARGAHVFREFVRAGGLRFVVPFNASDPINTPNTLDTTDPRVLQALATAVNRLRTANIPLNARLGDIQFVPYRNERLPIPGGSSGDGVSQVMDTTFLGADGYRAGGSTGFVYVAEFPHAGKGAVRSHGMVVYSISSNPDSAHSSDMTREYPRRIINWRFSENEINSDPRVERYRVSSREGKQKE